MRASDADRERVAAILRRHYEAGRLDDDDLERRLTRVLAARTLGQLREQVGDLPAPPPSLAQRLRYGGRALRHPVGVVGVIFLVLLVIGAIAGNSHETSSATSVSPAVAVPSFSPAPSPPAQRITTQRAGSVGVDDGIAFRVRHVTRRSSVALTYGHPSRLFPGPGREFAVVDVDYTNRAKRSMEPFCAGGARLFLRSHRAYEPLDRQYEVRGNDAMCGGSIEPDETALGHLVFPVPTGSRLAWIELWNGDYKGGDDLGNTRVRTLLDGVPGA